MILLLHYCGNSVLETLILRVNGLRVEYYFFILHYVVTCISSALYNISNESIMKQNHIYHPISHEQSLMEQPTL